MRLTRVALALLAIASATTYTQAAENIGRSNPLRKVLLDTVRPDIEADLGLDVQFVVDKLQVEGDWAYLAGSVQQADGAQIDFSETPYAEAEAEGMFDGPTLKALLSRQGNGWMLETYSIGATDVVEVGWPYEYGVPCKLVNGC